MSQDARFEDGDERALALVAVAPEDVPVISALAQDAIFPVTEIRWDRTARRFALLLNRFRWEDAPAARRDARPFERVQSLLVIGDVTAVASQGFSRDDTDLVMSLLAMEWEPGTDGTGRVVLTLAGDGAIAVSAECVDISLRDVTRPYRAVSGKAPQHPQ